MKRMLKGVEIKVTEEAWEDFLWSWFETQVISSKAYDFTFAAREIN